MEKKKVSFGARIKEFFRKRIVALKHKPQTIPLIMLVITFLYYSLHLTTISDTTAKINIAPMGLCEFVIMLLSMLSLLCFNNSFPHRKPVNKPMLILMFIMLGIIIGADVTYISLINQGLAKNPNIVAGNIYIRYAAYYLQIHIILMCVSIALVALLPVYSKLIRKIKTSVEVASGEMGELELTSQD